MTQEPFIDEDGFIDVTTPQGDDMAARAAEHSAVIPSTSIFHENNEGKYRLWLNANSDENRLTWQI